MGANKELPKTISGGYYGVKGSKVIQRLGKIKPFDDTDVLEHTSKEGVVSYYKEFDSFTGYITSVYFEYNEFLRKDELRFVMDGCLFAIDITSSHGRHAAQKILSADLTKEYKLVPYDFTTDDGKRRQGVNFYYAPFGKENKVISKYTKENPNGLPELEFKEFRGKVSPDDNNQIQFYKQEVAKLKFTEAAKKEVATVNDDDLPF